jgi:hypothetical protein
MSLPVPVSSSATPQAPPTVRSGASAKSSAALASARAHGAPRSGAGSPQKPPKARTGFASVLDAVQQDDRGSTVGSSRPAAVGVPRRDAQIDTDQTRARDGVAAPAGGRDEAAVVAPHAAPQTPWLLLALGSGGHAWQEPSSDTDGGEEVAAAPDGAAATATVNSGPIDLAAVATPLSTVPTVPIVPSATDAGASAPVGADLPVTGDLLPAAVAPHAGAGAPVAAATVAGDAAAEGEPGAIDASAGVGAPDDLAVTPDRSTAEVPAGQSAQPGPTDDRALPDRGHDLTTISTDRTGVAAWRSLGSQESDARSSAPPDAAPSSGPVAPARVAGRPTGRAAQWLGQAARPSVATSPAGESSALDIQNQAPSASGTTPARASEALLRLAQASDGAPSRHGGQAPMAHVPFAAGPSFAPPTAEVAAPSTPAALPPAVGDQVLHQVVSSLRMQWKDGIGEAKLQLRPDALGAVSISLRVEAGAVTAVVRAESAQVQEWVLQNQETLRQQMEAAGLHLGELVVTPDDQGQSQQQAPQEQRRRRQPAPAPAATFEMLL